MRKPVDAICEQQKCRSACAFAQPLGQISPFVVRCLDSIILLVSISEIWSLYQASVAAQAGLSLPWSQTTKTGSSWRGSIMFKLHIHTFITMSRFACAMSPCRTCALILCRVLDARSSHSFLVWQKTIVLPCRPQWTCMMSGSKDLIWFGRHFSAKCCRKRWDVLGSVHRKTNMSGTCIWWPGKYFKPSSTWSWS